MKKQLGFTLVELSIVLVIIGLLVGGVLTGQSLIRAAELRSVSAQEQRYISAISTFRDKYFAIPGDMTNAQSFWGVQNATPSTCVNSASTDSKTCNGDGNGQISVATGSNEYFRFWQHLANAGLIEGSYDGVYHGTNNFAGTTANDPKGRIGNSGWQPWTYGQITSWGWLFDGQYGNTLEFGTFWTNYDPMNSLLKPEDAYNIDMKLDDGKPATGNVRVADSANGTTANCASTATTSNMAATYNLANANITCELIFANAF